MRKNFKIVFVIALSILFCKPFYSQDWVKMMQDPTVNFFETQKAFNNYEAAYRVQYKKERGVEPASVPGYKIFKRWEWFMSPRVSETGERFSPDAAWVSMEKYKKENNLTNAGNWTSLGPSSPSNLYGAGRINAVRVHPTDPNTIFVCVPSGGLWKSTNSGTTWTTNTDFLPSVIGCTDIAIDPSNPTIMYLATGDGDAGDNYSVGLLKSTDAGATWQPSGLSFNMAQTRTMSKILIHPTNTGTLIISTSGGIYRTTDGGTTFTMVQAGGFKDLEFKTDDPNVVFASGTEFYKSTDAGATWTKITSGLPAAANVSRIAIGVAKSDPNRVYLIAGLPSPNYGTEGFYKSTDAGLTFAKSSTPNIGTQQWYDLCLDVSHTNPDEIHLGGQTQFVKSINGGTSFANTGGGTHVDYHDLVYTSGTSLYVTSDGGIWASSNNGGSWSNKSNGLTIAQMYGFGQSATNPNLHIQGWQDNGTARFNGSWAAVMGGDGMLCFISHATDNNMWGSQYSGSLNKSTNGGNNWSACKGNITGTGGWVTPWLEDPVTANTIYAGFNDVWKHTAGGGASGWTKISTFNSTATLANIAVSPADNNVIWATNGGLLYKTANGGTNWTTIASKPNGNVAYITCSYTDPNKAWIVFSGFNGNNKVFQTNDQGVTWINLSNSLPNIPVNCITVDKNGTDALYIGTDVGVYYRDASLTVWQPFSTNLPNVVVTQLIVFYPGSKIRASTYGRGMWESPLYVPGAYPPVANFNSQGNVACPGAAVDFFDQSSGPPTSWNWSFPGGSPATSGQQNPSVVYNTPGTYPVTLVATNGSGADTVSYTSYVTVSTSPYGAPTVKGDSICGAGTVNLSATGLGAGAGGTLRWWNASGGGSVVNTGQTYSPALSTTTTFYVDETFPPAADDYTGPTDNSMGAGAMFVANDIRGLYFDVLSPIILKSVDVYSNSAGKRTIEVQNALGTLMDTSVTIPASPTTLTTVPLNFKIYPGTGYFIKCTGLVDLYRNSAGSVFPYTSNSVNITGTNAGSSGYYYFFYNWVYTPIQCNTPRTPVTGIIGCVGINDDELTKGTLKIYPNPSNGKFDLSFNVNEKDNYTIKISNTLGQTVYDEKINNFSGRYINKIDISGKGKGVYMLSLTNSKNETVKRVIVY